MLKDLIAGAKDVEIIEADVPEWGTKVWLRQLSVEARLKLMEKVNDDNVSKLSVYVLLHTLCDQDGVLVFGPDDYDVLAVKNARVIDRLGKLAGETNMMTGSAVEDAKKN